MRSIIKDSTLWGRVRSAVVFAFTSKYALALYELITARVNMKRKWQEDFPVEDLRALLGVPEKKLQRIPQYDRPAANDPIIESVTITAAIGATERR